MAGWAAYGPAEVTLLLDPAADPRDVMKMALIALLLKGILYADATTGRGWIWPKTVRRLRQVRPRWDATSVEGAVLDAVEAGGEPKRMEDAVTSLGCVFGRDFRRFSDYTVLDELIRRGWMTRRADTILASLWKQPGERTPAGDAERDRVLRLIQRATEVSPILAPSGTEALALVAGLGAAVPLGEALHTHLSALRIMLKPPIGASGPGAGVVP